jgi:hypothetical protein
VGLGGALVLSIAGSATLLVTWRTDTQRYTAAAAFLDSSTAAGDRVMALDPSRLYLLSGHQGIAPPFDPYPVVARTIETYDVRWVVVTLEPGETRDPLGFWDGAAAVDADGNHATFLAATPAFEAPGVRIYPVVPPP